MYLSEFEIGYDVLRKARLENHLRKYLRNSRPEITNTLWNPRPDPKNWVSYKKKSFVSVLPPFCSNRLIHNIVIPKIDEVWLLLNR